MNNLRGVITQEELAALRERNERRIAAAIMTMGRTYLLHPNNHVKRKSS